MGRVLDGSYDPVVTAEGLEVETNSYYSAVLDSDFETYVDNTGLSSNEDFKTLTLLKTKIDQNPNLDWDRFGFIYLFRNNKTGSELYDAKSLFNLTSSGDHTTSRLGVNGGGTYYLDTSFNPSDDSVTAGKFSMGVVVTSDSNAGTDIGCNDASNYCFIQARDSGTCSMRLGTATAVSFANDGAKGHYVLNGRDGGFYAYKDYSNEGSDVFSGSMPNQDLYICGNNNNGTGADYANRDIGAAWIYNGELSEDGVFAMTSIMENITKRLLRYYG